MSENWNGRSSCARCGMEDFPHPDSFNGHCHLHPGMRGVLAALIITLCREIPFAAEARLVNPSWHRVAATCGRIVDLALENADFSEVTRLAVDETSRAKGHSHISLFTDADERRVLFVAEGHGADTVNHFGSHSPKLASRPEIAGQENTPQLAAGWFIPSPRI